MAQAYCLGEAPAPNAKEVVYRSGTYLQFRLAHPLLQGAEASQNLRAVADIFCSMRPGAAIISLRGFLWNTS